MKNYDMATAAALVKQQTLACNHFIVLAEKTDGTVSREQLRAAAADIMKAQDALLVYVLAVHP